LARKSVEKPGVAFNYSAGATETLAAIVKKATGQAIDAYIGEQIFKPLGITQFEWARRARGSVIVPSGLRLRSRDLAKFGMLYLERGKWNGRQIIRPELIDDAVTVHVVGPSRFPMEAR
jgi:CubicO group peptidase (beta-lactamase class C family)